LTKISFVDGFKNHGEEAALYLTDRLAKAYDQFLGTLPQNTYAKVDSDRWHLSVDKTEPRDPIQEAKLVIRKLTLPLLPCWASVFVKSVGFAFTFSHQQT